MFSRTKRSPASGPDAGRAGLYEVRGDRLIYRLHPGQQRAWESERRFVLMLAGTQSGKTSFGPLWLYREMERGGEGDYIAAAANYDILRLKLLPEMVGFYCQLLRWGEYRASDRLILSHDGKTRIILRSAESEGGLEAMTAKGAILDEFGLPCVSVEAWEAVQRRLAIHQGRALFLTTPYTIGWLKQQVFDRWRGGDRDYEVIQFPSTANPAFPQAEYERARAVLPDWKFAMFYDGEFRRPAGLIYGDYLDSYAPQRPDGRVQLEAWQEGLAPHSLGDGGLHGHLVRPFPIPAAWPRLVGVDFGGPEHLALVWLAEEPGSDRHYVYREQLGGGSGTEAARAALEYREPVNLWLGGAKSENDSRLLWQGLGVPVIQPVITDVEPGIDRVIALFRERRLFVFDSLTGLRSELGTYSRDLDAAGSPLLKIEEKQRFHRLDALRAVCTVIPAYTARETVPEPRPLTLAELRAKAVDDYDRRCLEEWRRQQREGVFEPPYERTSWGAPW